MSANVDNRTGILKVLQDNGEHEFYLTGSKFFVGSGNDTDCFVEDSNNLRRWLEALGFKRLGNKEHNYCDTNCVAVYRIECPVDGQVDIQCVIDVKMKNDVQNTLRAWAKNPGSDVIWDLMFTAYRKGYISGLEAGIQAQ